MPPGADLPSCTQAKDCLHTCIEPTSGLILRQASSSHGHRKGSMAGHGLTQDQCWSVAHAMKLHNLHEHQIWDQPA